MLHVYEFEVFEGESGMLVAFPYDLPGGTQGEDFKDVCESAADWLQADMEHRAMHGLDFPEATFGNEPEHPGGKTIVVAVNADKGTIRRMTAAEAARRLGLTRGRVSQMVSANLLETFELDGRIWVTEDSVNARLAETQKSGQARKRKQTIGA